jgi:predicted AAA+ superfamily ATPase
MRKAAKWKPLNHEEELELYFRVGGFPTALVESGPEGKTPIKSQETYRRWLLGDALKLGKSETYLKEIMSQIAITTGSSISLQKLAQRTQIGSHNTAQDYIEILESCFALKTLYEFDLQESTPKFRKEKKFYFRDPLIFWMALKWAGIKAPENSIDLLAEQVAHEALARKYNRFGFGVSKKGEVDFILPRVWAIEVKWKNQPTGLSQLYLDLLIPEKKVWFKGNFLK